jgi:hypothetical protein
MFTTISIVVLFSLAAAVIPFVASYRYYARTEQEARDKYLRAPKTEPNELGSPSTLSLSTFNFPLDWRVDRDMPQPVLMVGRVGRKRSWLATGIASLMLVSLFFPQATRAFARDSIAAVHKLLI